MDEGCIAANYYHLVEMLDHVEGKAADGKLKPVVQVKRKHLEEAMCPVVNHNI